MKVLELAIPPPVVMFVIGAIMWLLPFLFPAFAWASTSNFAAAVIISLIGLGISLAGMIAFGRARTTPDPRRLADASVLVTSSIYRFTRNPMYLGVLLILIAWGVLLGNVLALIGCALHYSIPNPT